MTKKQYAMNSQISGEDIKRLREMLGMTQREFASFAHCAVRTVENWETKKDGITGPIVPLVEIMLRHPELAEKLEMPSDRYKMRLIYRFKSTICLYKIPTQCLKTTARRFSATA